MSFANEMGIVHLIAVRCWISLSCDKMMSGVVSEKSAWTWSSAENRAVVELCQRRVQVKLRFKIKELCFKSKHYQCVCNISIHFICARGLQSINCFMETPSTVLGNNACVLARVCFVWCVCILVRANVLQICCCFFQNRSRDTEFQDLSESEWEDWTTPAS